MDDFNRIMRISLAILTGFVGLTACIGGIILLAGIFAPGVEYLQGSIFKDYSIPGFALLFMVGGSSLVAMLALLRKSRLCMVYAMISGVIIMTFEFVEVLVIGSPAGIFSLLQIFYFGLGFIIVLTAVGVWHTEGLAGAGKQLARA